MWFGGFGPGLVDRSTRTDSSDDLTFCTRSRRREREQNCEISRMGIFSGVIHILIGRFMGYRWPFAFRLLRAMQWARPPSVVSFSYSFDQADTKCDFACLYFRPSVRLMSFWLASLSTRRPLFGILLRDISDFTPSTCNLIFNLSNHTTPSSELNKII